MKKITLIILTLVMSFSATAGEITGKILKLRPDEEGMKVIIQAQDESITIAYLSNQATDFLRTVKTLESAKSLDAKIQITTKDNALAEVIGVKVLN